ncbi:hypothetical protein DL770_011703 [Monosporascus sp. CRB-9-2]|nr:hypothetical protein DL770_011703 [Monosporascus sp. CRB-9-2]
MPQSALLLGSGFVATPTIQVLSNAGVHVTVACRTLASAQKLAGNFTKTKATSLDAAIKAKKHVITTSYVSPAMQALDEEVKAAGITVMNEIGSKTAFKNTDEKNRLVAGLKWLGIFSGSKITPKGNPLDTLCDTLEEKMAYEEDERDFVHELVEQTGLLQDSEYKDSEDKEFVDSEVQAGTTGKRKRAGSSAQKQQRGTPLARPENANSFGVTIVVHQENDRFLSYHDGIGSIPAYIEYSRQQLRYYPQEDGQDFRNGVNRNMDAVNTEALHDDQCTESAAEAAEAKKRFVSHIEGTPVVAPSPAAVKKHCQ